MQIAEPIVAQQTRVPEVFRRTSPILATYNFDDIISGTGYITAYAGTTCSDGTNYLYRLSNFAYNPAICLTVAAGAANTTAAKLIDLDFDVLLNKPMEVRGEGIVTATATVYEVGGDQFTNTYIIAKLRKWDGSSETEVASGTSMTISRLGVAAGIGEDYTASMTIPLTNFKSGEYLRLTIEFWGYTEAGGNYTVGLYHDPMNATNGIGTGSTTSVLKFFIPVKIAL